MRSKSRWHGGHRIGLEALEARTLLAADFGLVGEFTIQPANLVDVTLPLQPWTEPNRPIGITFTDRGDTWWDQTERHLLRADNAVLVQLKPGVDVDAWLRSVQGVHGPLGAFTLVTNADNRMLEFRSAGGASNQQALDELPHDPNVLWISPTFTDADYGGESWVSNELVVTLDEGVSAAEFFAGRYSYERLGGTPDSFVVTIEGGFEQTLAASHALSAEAGVLLATPNFTSRFRIEPPNPDYVLIGSPAPVFGDPTIDHSQLPIQTVQLNPAEPPAPESPPWIHLELDNLVVLGQVSPPSASPATADLPAARDFAWVQINPAEPIPDRAIQLGGIVVDPTGRVLPSPKYYPPLFAPRWPNPILEPLPFRTLVPEASHDAALTSLVPPDGPESLSLALIAHYAQLLGDDADDE